MTRNPEIYVQYGMKRSGNHAISGWLLPKTAARYYNNIVPMGPIYAGVYGVPDLDDFETWIVTRSEDRGVSWRRRLLGRVTRPWRKFYVSVEDLPLGIRVFAKQRPTNILVLRSFENMMSSRIHKAFKVDMPAYPREMSPVLLRVVETWKDHARSYLAMTTDGRERVAILLDAWMADRSYRNAICQKLDLPLGDDGMEVVRGAGGGNSFSEPHVTVRPRSRQQPAV